MAGRARGERAERDLSWLDWSHARDLSRDGRVTAVYYPGLEQHPDHAIAVRQMSGFGGMVCLDVGGGYDRAARFFDRLREEGFVAVVVPVLVVVLAAPVVADARIDEPGEELTAASDRALTALS